jgi:hypothetical protein
MSHFTARAILAGLELYQQGASRRFILPGEQRAPATSDLELMFLLRRGIQRQQVLDLPNRNGTLEQLEPVARLQRDGQLREVLVECFAFHAARVRALMDLLHIAGDLAEVEQTHAAFLRARTPTARVSRAELVNLLPLERIRQAEERISRRLLALDRWAGRWAPLTRLFKLVAGPTITDIEFGRARVGLVRVETLRKLLSRYRTWPGGQVHNWPPHASPP